MRIFFGSCIALRIDKNNFVRNSFQISAKKLDKTTYYEHIENNLGVFRSDFSRYRSKYKG